MRILQFIMGKADPNRANGVNRVIYEISTELKRLGHDVVVIGLSKGMLADRQLVNRGAFDVEVFRSFRCVLVRIGELINTCDIVHMHGAWNHQNTKLAHFLYKKGVPYVITPHAGLAEDRLRQSNYLLKKCYQLIFQRKIFDRAAGIHGISREETTDICRFTGNTNVFFVPNGINMAEMNRWRYSVKERDVLKAGYLGRVSPEKNLDTLVRAIALLPNELKEKIEFYFIGPMNADVQVLKELVRSLHLSDRVFFENPVFGEEKIQKLLNLDFYVHPALSEGGSISVIEVLSLGFPSVITRTSHVSYYYDPAAFVMVEPTVQDLSSGLAQLIGKKDDWDKMSQKSRLLAKKYFDVEKSTKCLAEEYENMISSFFVG